jgi:hypothetical protein
MAWLIAARILSSCRSDKRGCITNEALAMELRHLRYFVAGVEFL